MPISIGVTRVGANPLKRNETLDPIRSAYSGAGVNCYCRLAFNVPSGSYSVAAILKQAVSFPPIADIAAANLAKDVFSCQRSSAGAGHGIASSAELAPTPSPQEGWSQQRNTHRRTYSNHHNRGRF